MRFFRNAGAQPDTLSIEIQMSEHDDELPGLRIAAALLVREDGHTLLVRKRGTTSFMQPGGKIDPGETAQCALVRELNEELGISVDVNSLVPLGHFSAPAANEAGLNVHADLFLVECDQSVRPEAEIEEIAWVAANVLPDFPLAPLTGSFVLPLHNGLRRG
jgi:8-oxo-dGTP pyrophosphatase MutT (NUDIX family)